MRTTVGYLVSAVAAAALGGCATSLAPEAPAGVDLAGPWKLDHGASDDPQKLLTKMRTEAFHLMGQRQAMPVVRPGQGRQEPPIPAPGQEDYSPDAHGHRPDPLLRSPMARVILTSVARGDYLAIRQREGVVVFDYGVARRSFTPGAHSVVSTVDGSVGDQTSGWKGREYLIVQKGEMGPEVTERVGLSGDGRQLIDKVHIGAAELSAVDFTRVYNRTNEAAPRQLPVSD